MKNIEFSIAKAVWEGQIDGLQTADVANEFGVSTKQALKILNKIISGDNSDFDFVREECYDGVSLLRLSMEVQPWDCL